MRFGTTGASTGHPAEVCGGLAGRTTEHLREMTLVKEPGARADLGKRAIRLPKVVGGPLDPEPSQVLADRSPISRAEGASEVRRVDADGRGDRGETVRSTRIVV